MSSKLVTLPVVTVVSAGTAVPLTLQPTLARSIVIQASYSNTGHLYIGDATVDATNGQELPPGDTMEIVGDARATGSTDELVLNTIYINSATSGNSARIIITKNQYLGA